MPPAMLKSTSSPALLDGSAPSGEESSGAEPQRLGPEPRHRSPMRREIHTPPYERQRSRDKEFDVKIAREVQDTYDERDPASWIVHVRNCLVGRAPDTLPFSIGPRASSTPRSPRILLDTPVLQIPVAVCR